MHFFQSETDKTQLYYIEYMTKAGRWVKRVLYEVRSTETLSYQKIVVANCTIGGFDGCCI